MPGDTTTVFRMPDNTAVIVLGMHRRVSIEESIATSRRLKNGYTRFWRIRRGRYDTDEAGTVAEPYAEERS